MTYYTKPINATSGGLIGLGEAMGHTGVLANEGK